MRALAVAMPAVEVPINITGAVDTEQVIRSLVSSIGAAGGANVTINLNVLAAGAVQNNTYRASSPEVPPPQEEAVKKTTRPARENNSGGRLADWRGGLRAQGVTSGE